MARHEKTKEFCNQLPELMSWFYHEEELKEKLLNWLDEYYTLQDSYETAKATKDTNIDAVSASTITDNLTTMANTKNQMATAIDSLS